MGVYIIKYIFIFSEYISTDTLVYIFIFIVNIPFSVKLPTFLKKAKNILKL